MNILIVDDHEMNRYMLETLLAGNGHEIQEAEDGARAMDIIQAGGVDLIISDILMPVMDGFQLCKTVKADKTLRKIPFIIYTATYTGPQDEAFALKLGADRFITKPCEPDEFLTAVNEVITTNSRQEAALHEPMPEEDVFRMYSERLVKKLEQKMLQAEKEIAERKRAEAEREKLKDQLLQAQKMESIGRLAGGVAHDYNNMLSVIIGYAELALEKTSPEDSIHNDLSQILAAANRSADITRQLLAFARKQTVHPKILDLNYVIKDILKMLDRLIGEDIELIWRPGSEVWPVKMDPSQIDQILANLLVNAKDAIAEANSGLGRIIIETANASFDSEDGAGELESRIGEFVLLSVGDNGRGMDKETLNNIFEPFFTTKSMGQGTGLGLATVYGVVKQNNGFINVYSEPQKGTVFRIYLPRHASKAEQVSIKKAGKIPQGRGETVLVIEDEAAILELAGKMLQDLNYVPLCAATPAQAIEMVREHAGQIDLLIADMVMPEMNGRDLASELLAIDPGIKVLFMSSFTTSAVSNLEGPAGVVHFMRKPFSRQEMAVKAREVLGS